MDLVTVGLFLAGGALLVAGAELLVRGGSRLAVAAGISPLVVGLTVVAFGTSSPELAVTAGAALAGQTDVALGNVLGSNIFNVLMILGLAALTAPLMVAQQLVRFDVPLMIATSVLLLVLALDGSVSRLDGVLLSLGLVGYTIFTVRQSRRETSAIRQEYEQAFGKPSGRGRTRWGTDLASVAFGLALLVLGARWLVDSAVSAATAWGVSELVISLTIVAAGTSLPELATSILAGMRGERDIAVGNVVGSNLFNLLGVLGIGSVLAPGGVPVAPGALGFDIPVMIAVAVAVLPVAFTGSQIARWEGLVFVAYYGAYIAFLFLSATEHHALPAFSAAMAFFVLPLTALTLAVLALRALRK